MPLSKKEIILSESKRIVIKLGSRILTEETPNTPVEKGLSIKRIKQVAQFVSKLRSLGKEVVIVSSGAVGAGMGLLGFDKKPKSLQDKQACAALGQVKLMNLYSESFLAQDLNVGQLLVSAQDFRRREQYTNIKNTTFALLELGIVPIFNENDSVATDEIKVGDNDKLSADVSHLLSADLLILFSDEDGFFDSNPKKNPEAKLFDVIEEVNEDILGLADEGAGSEVSTGGMKTKLQAIYAASLTKCNVILANGFTSINETLFSDPNKGTLFLSQNNDLSSRQKWLGYASTASFFVMVDEGAEKALKNTAASLLVMGVMSFNGDFTKGDLIDICNLKGETIARGTSTYHWKDLAYIIKEPKEKLVAILEKIKLPIELIHRNDMMLLKSSKNT
jgi:glutamate 5-kinase